MDFSEAYKIGDRMAKPWQWATAILSAVVAGLLYVIIASEISVDNSVEASNITADSLITTSKVQEK